MPSPHYQSLIKLKVPFFKLNHGRLYECKVEHNKGIEKITIIPLAFKPGRNQQFVMIDATNLYKKNPNYVKEIIEMDFEYIMNDGIKADYPFDYDSCTSLCATNNDNTLIDTDDNTLFDFIEIEFPPLKA